MSPMIKLNKGERRMLALLHPAGATIALGLGVGTELNRRGFVNLNRFKRWEITGEGRIAIEGYPQELKSYLASTR